VPLSLVRRVFCHLRDQLKAYRGSKWGSWHMGKID
jgi:hypothetical protein